MPAEAQVKTAAPWEKGHSPVWTRWCGLGITAHVLPVVGTQRSFASLASTSRAATGGRGASALVGQGVGELL